MIGPVQSGGGPYLVLPAGAASAWRGAADRAAYEAVSRGPDEGRLTRIAGQDALTLGTPDPLYYAPLADGGVLVRVVSFDADDDEVLAGFLEQLPREGWQPFPGKLQVRDGALLAFDSAIAGDEAVADALRLELTPASYAVSGVTFTPDDGTELLLTRLQRIAPPERQISPSLIERAAS
jgi:hypothetical protein